MGSRYNYQLTIEYDGTNYHGWQSQNNAIAIQDIIEKSVKKLTGKKVRMTGSGRTDTGVHARGQVANIYLPARWTSYKLRKGLNAYLPPDIVITAVKEVSLEFNARFDARRRIYQYFISRKETAVQRNYAWQVFYRLNESMLITLGSMIIGVHDFSSFSRVDTQTESKICEVFDSYWREENDFLIYRIEANRFLHGMVRTLVGTMVDVARGRFSKDQFEQILVAQDRKLAGQTAPALGLFLEKVIYDEGK